MKASPRKHTTSRYLKTASVRESKVLLFGNIADRSVQESKRKIEISGRQVEVQASLAQQFGTEDQLSN